MKSNLLEKILQSQEMKNVKEYMNVKIIKIKIINE
jgi:hypothetical protein